MITRKELKTTSPWQSVGQLDNASISSFDICCHNRISTVFAHLREFPCQFEPVTLAVFVTVGFVLTIFLIPLEYGYEVSFLRFCKGNTLTIKEMFDTFFGDYAKAFVRVLVVSIFIFLWSLLLIIPGIIKSLAYSMSFFISDEHPEMTTLQCIDESERMMKGHKWELFILKLSFIGWILLAILTLGIGFLWLAPYMHTTKVKFYEQLKLENVAEVAWFS